MHAWKTAIRTNMIMMTWIRWKQKKIDNGEARTEKKQYAKISAQPLLISSLHEL